MSDIMCSASFEQWVGVNICVLGCAQVSSHGQAARKPLCRQGQGGSEAAHPWLPHLRCHSTATHAFRQPLRRPCLLPPQPAKPLYAAQRVCRPSRSICRCQPLGELPASSGTMRWMQAMRTVAAPTAPVAPPTTTVHTDCCTTQHPVASLKNTCISSPHPKHSPRTFAKRMRPSVSSGYLS